MDTEPSYLSFNVKPHLIEDLGVNLYTSLSKALVEFVANAHDADANYAKIEMDAARIREARAEVKQAWQDSQEEGKPADLAQSLERARLPDSVEIRIKDDGHGMNRKDLDDKFLNIGRRRRGSDVRERSPEKRIIMGRKGLGKLAGFGIAHKMIVISKTKADYFPWEIELDYDAMMVAETTGHIKIPIRKLETNDVLGENSGTVVILSKLTFSGTDGAQSKAINSIANYFRMVDVDDFCIWHDDQLVEAKERTYDFAYPELGDGNDYLSLVSKKFTLGDGKDYKLDYRFRFTPSKGQLKEHERGVRIYAHGRLAAAPSLFEIPTSSNGYQYSSYLDGVVVADFIDEQPIDYVATDRQGLRWETPFLKPLSLAMQSEIKSALDAVAKARGEATSKDVHKDLFTKQVIEGEGLPKHRQTLAYKIAVTLAKSSPDSIKASYYKEALPLVVKGLGKGDILEAISGLAALDAPDLTEVVREVTELTKQEFGDFLSFVQGRISGIMALKKICLDQNFKKSNNERQLQKLFEENPWLIDPTFYQFMTADQKRSVVNQKLSEKLKIGSHVPGDYSSDDEEEQKEYGQNLRPDLVFLLNSLALGRIVIVELKAPNTPLHIDHLQQLKDYMMLTREYMDAHHSSIKCEIRGMLIGCRADGSTAKKVQALKFEESERSDAANWEVFDINEVLTRTEDAHRQLVDIYEGAEAVE